MVHARSLLPAHARAAQRAADWLEGCLDVRGRALDPVGDPLAALRGVPSRAVLYRLAGGSDIWHTAAVVRALRACGRDPRASVAFLSDVAGPDAGASHWSARPALCFETVAAVALVLPERRASAAALARRMALPGPSWTAFLLEGAGGHAAYCTAPSVNGWVLGLLDPAEPLAEQARGWLRASRRSDGGWLAHDGFYGTPLYAAHVCAAHVGDDALVRHVRSLRCADGGWGFGQALADTSSPLTTAWALQALLACGVPRDDADVQRAVRFLLRCQSDDGRFPLGACPEPVFYTGDLYTTACAVLALADAGCA
jgi:hypothetical protein